MNPQTDTPEQAQPMRGKIATGSLIDVRAQADLYRAEMGRAAAERQMALRREELLRRDWLKRKLKGKA